MGPCLCLQVVFVDPSPVADCAGWPLRNLVAAVAYLMTSWTWCSFVALKGGSDLKEYKISWKQTEVWNFGFNRTVHMTQMRLDLS